MKFFAFVSVDVGRSKYYFGRDVLIITLKQTKTKDNA